MFVKKRATQCILGTTPLNSLKKIVLGLVVVMSENRSLQIPNSLTWWRKTGPAFRGKLRSDLLPLKDMINIKYAFV